MKYLYSCNTESALSGQRLEHSSPRTVMLIRPLSVQVQETIQTWHIFGPFKARIKTY